MSKIFVDGHVHIHPPFDRVRFLDAAAANFQAAASASRVSREAPEDDLAAGILLLTESAGVSVFDAFLEIAERDSSIGPWAASLTGEAGSVRLNEADIGFSLFMMAGRQIVTLENLEVLALATPARFEEGRSMESTIEAVRNAGGIPVVPWGFGKWTGRRGEIIQSLIQAKPEGVYFGDNGGRPAGMGRPGGLKAAARNGISILPGTDPLPFSNEAEKAGRFGWWMTGTFDEDRPVSAVKNLLLDPATPIRSYGVLENPLKFLLQQVRMQIRKRIGGTS